MRRANPNLRITLPWNKAKAFFIAHGGVFYLGGSMEQMQLQFIASRERTCPICATIFRLRRPGSNQRCCSMSCRAKLQWKDRPEMFADRTNGWKGKRHSAEAIQKMRDNGWNGEYRQLRTDGYIAVRQPNHPRARFGRVPEQVIVAEKALGRYLKPDEQVHHINMDKTDNRNRNLLVCDIAYHSWLHWRIKKREQRQEEAVAWLM